MSKSDAGKGDRDRANPKKYASNFPECGAYDCKKMRKKSSYFCVFHAAELLPTNPPNFPVERDRENAL